MNYYIETHKKDSVTGFLTVVDRIVSFDESEPAAAYTAYIEICKDSTTLHAVLRTLDHSFHGLIAEYTATGPHRIGGNPYWFTEYPEYKAFSAGLNIEPAREQLQREKAEFLKRFPNFSHRF